MSYIGFSIGVGFSEAAGLTRHKASAFRVSEHENPYQ
jgi:hypothetical protein